MSTSITPSATSQELANDFGDGVPIGDQHYRAWVGPPEYYDRIGALQFRMLTQLGMRETHKLADVGCGSLRGGRLSIMYLRPGNYYGIEPTAWALHDGIAAHLGEEFVGLKQPTFLEDAEYSLEKFGVPFDFINVHSVFTHAPGNHVRRCLQQARASMHERSIFVATYLESDTDHVGEEFVYPWVTQFRRDSIERWVTDAGLRCIHLDLGHPFDQRWFLAVDPANDIDAPTLLAGEVYSYETYLKDEMEAFGGTRRSYAEYLREDLAQQSAGKRHLPR